MSDRNLKYNGTPLNHFKTPSSRQRLEKGLKREMSDSEESVTSNPDSDNLHIPSNGTNELSLVAEFDELMRLVKNRRNDAVEDSFLEFAIQVQKICESWQIAYDECQRLQLKLDNKTHEFSDLENKLAIARKLLDQEKRNTRKVEDERDLYITQITKVRDVLFRDGRSRIPEETKEKLKFLNLNRKSYDDILMSPPLNAIREGNTTGSLLSDFSYSMSEDDLDGTALKCGKSWKKHRPSMDGPIGEPATKKRRSSANKVVEINNTETVRATTTLTVSKKGGPITAMSVIESVPQHQKEEPDGNCLRTPTYPKPAVLPHHNIICDMWQNPSPQQNHYTPTPKQHNFQSKTVVMPDTCGPCNKRIRFGKTALKCRNCRAICHPECKDNLPVPCIPCANTPTQRHMSGLIADYTPTTPPMVPAIIVHCLKEIEAKGLSELGIYRIPGAERDVKCLKEKFLKGRGAPCLSQVDVHVICGTVKDFLRSLSEPLITYGLWGDFVKAVENQNTQDLMPTLCQIISELPQPNRDTLAYMILHLRRVAESKECKMPISNLAKVFGPTIVGYSSADPDPSNLIMETRQQVAVMEQLINLPLEYWQNFIVEQKLGTMRLQQTPSTDSLLRPTTGRGFFTPQLGRNMDKKRKKMLPTPPALYN